MRLPTLQVVLFVIVARLADGGCPLTLAILCLSGARAAASVLRKHVYLIGIALKGSLQCLLCVKQGPRRALSLRFARLPDRSWLGMLCEGEAFSDLARKWAARPRTWKQTNTFVSIGESARQSHGRERSRSQMFVIGTSGLEKSSEERPRNAG
jgi:hypothetical protein